MAEGLSPSRDPISALHRQVRRLDLAEGGNILTNPDEAKASRNEHLTETTKDGKIELTEEELNRASGGTLNFAKITFSPSPLDIKGYPYGEGSHVMS